MIDFEKVNEKINSANEMLSRISELAMQQKSLHRQYIQTLQDIKQDISKKEDYDAMEYAEFLKSRPVSVLHYSYNRLSKNVYMKNYEVIASLKVPCYIQNIKEENQPKTTAFNPNKGKQCIPTYKIKALLAQQRKYARSIYTGRSISNKITCRMTEATGKTNARFFRNTKELIDNLDYIKKYASANNILKVEVFLAEAIRDTENVYSLTIWETLDQDTLNLKDIYDL